MVLPEFIRFLTVPSEVSIVTVTFFPIAFVIVWPSDAAAHVADGTATFTSINMHVSKTDMIFFPCILSSHFYCYFYIQVTHVSLLTSLQHLAKTVNHLPKQKVSVLVLTLYNPIISSGSRKIYQPIDQRKYQHRSCCTPDKQSRIIHAKHQHNPAD